MPKIGEKVTGSYNSRGMTAQGSGVANIPYEPPCPCPSSDPYPAKVGVELLHYEGEGTELFKMQIDSVEQPRIQNTTAEFTRRQPKPTAHNALHPTRTEKVPGGTVVLYDYKSQCMTDCKGEGYPEGEWAAPHVNLLGMPDLAARFFVLATDEGEARRVVSRRAADALLAFAPPTLGGRQRARASTAVWGPDGMRLLLGQTLSSPEAMVSFAQLGIALSGEVRPSLG